MNKMDSKYLDEVPVENYQPSIQNILETTRMDLTEAKSMLGEIWRCLDAREIPKRDELEVPDMKTEAIAVQELSKDIVAIVHEIFTVLFGNH